MPDKELQGFSINFETNAAQAAADVNKLNEAQQNLSKDTEKNSAKDAKNANRRSKLQRRSNKDLHNAVKELKELNAQLKKQREETEKIDKAGEKAVNNQGISLNKAQRRLVAVLGVMRSGMNLFSGMMNLVQENAQYAISQDILGSPGVKVRHIAALHGATMEWGGNAQSAAADLERLNNIQAQMRQGINPLGDLAGRYPGLMDAFMGRNGKFYSEPEVLANLHRQLMSIQDPYLRKDMIRQLGLSDATFALLNSPDFSGKIANGEQSTAGLIKSAEEAKLANQKFQEAILSLKSDIAPALADIASWMNENKTLVKGLIITKFAGDALGNILNIITAILLLRGFPSGGGGFLKNVAQWSKDALKNGKTLIKKGIKWTPVGWLESMFLDGVIEQDPHIGELWKQLWETDEETQKRFNETPLTDFMGRPISYQMPQIPPRYTAPYSSSSPVNVNIGDITINAPGGDSAEIAQAGDMLIERMREEAVNVFREIDRGYSRTEIG